MSDKRADKPRYWVTYLLKDLPVGGTFKPDVLHLTIIPWFVTQLSENEVKDSFTKTFSGETAFEATIGRLDEFRDKRRIIFNYVEPKAKLISLHAVAIEWFSELGARWALQHPRVGEEFIPHIRRRPSTDLSEGDKLQISSLSLVRANRRGDDFRIVNAKVKFHEEI